MNSQSMKSAEMQNEIIKKRSTFMLDFFQLYLEVLQYTDEKVCLGDLFL